MLVPKNSYEKITYALSHPGDVTMFPLPSMVYPWVNVIIIHRKLSSWHTLGRRPRTFVAFLLIGVGGVGWGNNVHLHFLTDMMLRYCVGWGGVITFICTSSHTLMSEDVKAMVNQWVFRQSLGPITPIAFLEELKRLLKQ